MSGICGIVTNNGAPVRREWIDAMLEAAAHRGPDGRAAIVGADAGSDVGAGFGYLAHHVTPQAPGEAQPVRHDASGVTLVADVRLDNREELLGLLEVPDSSRTREFSRTSAPDRTPASDQIGDAAIVLAAYLAWGAGFAARLLGDFALAIRDPRSDSLLLVRDPMGMRPLYFADTSGRALFASEVKQILAAPDVDRRVNTTAVEAHLRGEPPESGSTFYEGISEVEPGCRVTIAGGRRSVRRFRGIDAHARLRYRRDSEYAEHFRELFLSAVECRLRTVKPVGISLSGGMDSGSVAAAAGWLSEQGRSRYTPELRAYCWAFDELPECDERAVSRLITDRYAMPVTEIDTSTAWPLIDYPAHGPDEDEPFMGHYQALIDATVAAAAHDGAAVVLSGDRGDLVAGGNVIDLPGLLFSGRWAALGRDVDILATSAKIPLPRIAWHYLARPVLAGAVGAIRPKDDRSANRALRSRHDHVFSQLHMGGMVWSDRTNANAGVGFADAWSDRRIAEFVLSVPQHVLHTLDEPKRLVRAAMRGIMPEGALAGARKVSPAPLYVRAVHELARSTVESLSRDMVASEMGFVDETDFARRVRGVLETRSRGFDLWATLTLEMWLRRYWR